MLLLLLYFSFFPPHIFDLYFHLAFSTFLVFFFDLFASRADSLDVDVEVLFFPVMVVHRLVVLLLMQQLLLLVVTFDETVCLLVE